METKKTTKGGEVMEYRDFTIDTFNDGYTVEYCGDEIYFPSLQEAKDFIDETIARNNDIFLNALVKMDYFGLREM